MSEVRMKVRTGGPALAAKGLRASPRPFSVTRASFAVAWALIGVAGASAVAAAAIYLPLSQGRSVSEPGLRSSLLPDPPARAFDVTHTSEWVELVGRVNTGLGLADEDSWKPLGGLSTLLATRFPSSGNVRLPNLAIAAPLPMPRPDGIEAQLAARQDIPRQDTVRQDVARPDAPRATVARTVPVTPDAQVASLPPQKSEPGIFDKLFGDPDRSAKAVLAANPNAVLYDIVRRVVYMPDGEKLEAHSGFGPFMDDPQSMHRKDVGVTPPNVYTVSFREKPFHGVRALRMKPVGDGNMYGRDGILAHSYLLGEAGASNGCISVRDYDKFLQAFEQGKFDKIIVLRSSDEPLPSLVASMQGQGT
jgi:hypothetical protein